MCGKWRMIGLLCLCLIGASGCATASRGVPDDICLVLPDIRGTERDAEVISDQLLAGLDAYYAFGAKYGCWTY